MSGDEIGSVRSKFSGLLHQARASLGAAQPSLLAVSSVVAGPTLTRDMTKVSRRAKAEDATFKEKRNLTNVIMPTSVTLPYLFGVD